MSGPRAARARSRARRAAPVAAALALLLPSAARADLPAPSAPAAARDSVAAPAADFGSLYEGLVALRADSTRVARVEGLVLERDAGRFVFEEGLLWLGTPVLGRTCAAVFVGRGVFSLAPPTAIERDQVRRIYGSDSVERRFEAVAFVIADSTAAELAGRLAFARGQGEPRAHQALSECLRFVSGRKPRWIAPWLAKPLLEGVADGHLLALIESADGDRLLFEVDPHQTEEVILWREPRARHVGLKRVWRRDVVTQFAAGGGRPAETVEGDTRPSLEMTQVRLECRIADDLDFAGVVEFDLISLERQRWLPFTLFERLSVDSVAWSDGRPAHWSKEDESPFLWVRCDPALAAGERRTLRIAYRGPVIERVRDWMLLRSSLDWYPKHDGLRRVPFEIVFHSPAQYHLVSIGRRISSATEGRVTTTRWSSERPVRNASFVIGVFREEEFRAGDGPPVTALMFRGKPAPISMDFGDMKIVSGARMDRSVARQAAEAVAFFQRVFGPALANRITIAELPDLGGEAFPGLVQLSWSPWWGPNAGAEDAVFRAHEVAHQWWGYSVYGSTYRDHWLSEGFADFAGLWFVQEGLGNQRSYLDVLAGWRERILPPQRFRPSGSPPPGPVSLGWRSGSIEAPHDFDVVIYKKGAWVLHMLRHMLLDLATLEDQRFASLMRDFYARHQGRTATTADFRAVAERYAGEDLGWFFDQWVHGTGAPTYRVAWRSERQPDGRYRVTCRVTQSDVPPGFRMPVIVRVDFGRERFAWVRILVTGERSEHTLPLMELEPQDVVFNDLESVLCRVEKERW